MWSLFYRNTRLLILIICLILVWGISSWQLIPRMEDPQLSQWYGFVLTSYPGASAPRVESLVTDKIEQELLEIDSIKTIESISNIGSSFIRIELKNTVRDFERVWSQVRDTLADLTPQLPEAALEPEYQEVNPTAYTFVVGLTWDFDLPTNYGILRRLAKQLKDEFRLIPGTQEVNLFSEPLEEIIVELNRAYLSALNLTPQELSKQISLSDAKIPTGELHSTDNNLLMEVASELDSLERIRQIPIRSGNLGQLSRLGDISSVTKGIRQPPLELAFVNGKPGVVLAMRIDPSYRIDKWIVKARQTVQQFRQRIPQGMGLEIILDQNNYVTKRLNSLFHNLLLGALFVVATTWLMMGLKSALVVGSALPLSMMMVLGEMNILHIPLHQISVTGLTIALGMLIDNAIIVVDEVQYYLRQGTQPQIAISNTVSYLAIPLLASNLTSILTFIPIVLLPGDVGEFVKTFAITTILALISSLFLSLTIIPALIGKIYRKTWQKNLRKGDLSTWNQGFSHPSLSRFYSLTLDFILAKPTLGILLALILPTIGFLMAPTLPEQFFPPVERDQFHIELELSSSASLKKTQSATEKARNIILQHPEVKNLHWFLGNEAPEFYYNLRRRGASRSNYAHGIVQLVSEKSINKLISRLQNELDRALPSVRVLVRRLEQGPYIAAPIEIRVYGTKLKVLKALGKQIRLVLSQVKGITNTSNSLSEALPKLALHLDEKQGKLTGLDNTLTAEQLNTHIEGSLGGSILEGTEKLPIRVRLSNRDRSDLEQITTIDLIPNIATKTENRSPIPLSAIGKIKLVPEISTITRRNGRRINRIQGFMAPNILPAMVLEDFKQKFNTLNLQLPPGYSIEFGGESEKRNQTLRSLTSIVSVLFVLMLATLVLSFNSFQAAGIIILVGIGSIGLGLFSLWCFGYPFGFMAILGTVGLTGVAINDSIVVLAALRSQPTANTEEAKIKLAILRSTRHVLTTTITTVAGFMPLLLLGSDFWSPLAICIVSGVIGATLLALYFVPCVYLIMVKQKLLTSKI